MMSSRGGRTPPEVGVRSEVAEGWRARAPEGGVMWAGGGIPTPLDGVAIVVSCSPASERVARAASTIIERMYMPELPVSSRNTASDRLTVAR